MEASAEVDSDDEMLAGPSNADAGDQAIQSMPKYNSELESLISQAVLANVNKRYKRAIKLCLEILKMNTRIPEAYELQAEAYENMPELDESVRQAKAIEWLEMGCNLLPGNKQLTVKLAEAFWKSGKFKQADEEYSKLVRKHAEKVRLANVEKKRIDIGILFKRAQAREKYSTDRAKVVDAYLDVLRSLKGNEQHAEEGLSLMRKLLRECHQLDDAPRGLAVTEAYYDAFPNRMEMTDIRALIELFFLNGHYAKVIGVFRDRLGVQLKYADNRNVDLTTWSSSDNASGIVQAQCTCVIPTENIPACVERACQSNKDSDSLTSDDDKASYVSFIDLYSRLFVALIRLGQVDAYRTYDRFVLRMRPIFKLNDTPLSEAYLDIVDALTSTSEFADASRLLSALLKVDEFQLAGVYLKHGDVLEKMDELVAASVAYRQVIRLSCKQVDAHVRLLRVLQRIDEADKSGSGEQTSEVEELRAFEILQWINDYLRGEDDSCVDLRGAPRATIEALAELVISKCERLYTRAKRELSAPQVQVQQLVRNPQSCVARFTLLVCTFLIKEISERTSEELLIALLFPPTTERRADRARQLGLFPDSRSESNGSLTLVGIAKAEHVYSTYLHACEVLYETGQFEALRRVTLHALIVPALVRDTARLREVNFQLIVACIRTRRLPDARLLVQYLFRQNLRSSRLHCWFSLLSEALTQSDASASHRKNVYRLFAGSPDEPILVMLAAGAFFVSGFIKHALHEYTFLYKHVFLTVSEDKRDPLIPLMLAMCMLTLAGQQKVKASGTRKMKRKTSYALQAMAFLNEYTHLRGETQETFYNLGRVMQQMSLYPYAVSYYRKVLELEPPGETASSKQALDLRREAAFNLCAIYRANGSFELASIITEQYLVL